MQKTNKDLSLKYNRFYGINSKGPKGDLEPMVNIRNFRITDSGSLEKRCGYRYLFSGQDNIRAVWTGEIEGTYSCFLLCGNNLCSYDPVNQTLSTLLTISSSYGKAQFFFYNNMLYLSTEEDLVIVKRNEAFPSVGYVPLYGKDWSTTAIGEVFEAPNMLNGIIRITYKIPDLHKTMLPVGRPISGILSIYRNGQLVPPDDYHFNTTVNAIIISSLEPGDRVCACIALDISAEMAELTSAPYATVFGSINDRRLIMWGGSKPNKVFTASKVGDEDKAEAEIYFPHCGGLYFPLNCGFTVGDGRYPVKAATSIQDKLLIFTEGEVWMTKDSFVAGEEFPLMTVSSYAGCTTDNGVVTVKDKAVSIGSDALYMWDPDAYSPSGFTPQIITDEIKERLSPDFFKNAVVYYDKTHNEIWMHNKYFGGTIWVYKENMKAWVSFDDFQASSFFNFNGNVGFTNESSVFRFEDYSYSDRPRGYTDYPIYACFEMKNVYFGTVKKKRIYGFTASGLLGHDCIKASFTVSNSSFNSRTDYLPSYSVQKIRTVTSKFDSAQSLLFYSDSNADITVDTLEIHVR